MSSISKKKIFPIYDFILKKTDSRNPQSYQAFHDLLSILSIFPQMIAHFFILVLCFHSLYAQQMKPYISIPHIYGQNGQFITPIP
jgi:hypothetical protein